jgi:hypothetical protein
LIKTIFFKKLLQLVLLKTDRHVARYVVAKEVKIILTKQSMTRAKSRENSKNMYLLIINAVINPNSSVPHK